MNDITPSKPRPDTPPTPAARPGKRRRWVRTTAITLAVLSLLTIILLPVGVQYGLRDWLLENGAQSVQIDDVDLNLFTGTLQIKGIRIDADQRNTLRADRVDLNFDWQALVRQRLTLTTLQLSGIDIEIAQNDNGELRIGGILLPASDAAPSRKQEPKTPKTTDEEAGDWKIGIDQLHLSDTNIRYSQPKLKVDTDIKQFNLKNLAAWTPEKSAQVLLEASINGAPLSFNGGIAPFAKPLRVDGHIELAALQLADFAQIAAVADELKGSLSLQADVDISVAETGLAAKLQAEKIQLDALRFITADIHLQQQQLRWAGDIDLQQDDGLRLSAIGNLSNKQLALRLPAQKLDITQDALNTHLDADIRSGENAVVNITAQVDKTDITQLQVAANDFPLASIEQIAIHKLQLGEAGRLAIQQIQLDKLYLARPSAKTAAKTAGDNLPALFSNQRLTLEALTLTPAAKENATALRIQNILFDDADIYIHSDRDGKTNIDQLLAAIEAMNPPAKNDTPAAPTETTASAQADDKPATFHIGHIQLSDGSSIVIDDASTTPTTRIDIGIESLSVDNLDNSSPQQVTRLATQGKFGRFGSYTLSGEIQPFNKKANGKLLADIKGIDLPRLSPYTARDLGFRLRSGTLDSDIDIAITDDQLSGNSQLVLHQLELIPLDNKPAEKQGGEMTAASLNTSLNMLRDKNNTITLKIPLSGDINAPDFSIQNVLNQALMSGVKTGMMTYALLALQPYGTMVVVAKYAGDQISKLRLDPVKFEPGSSELDATAKDYLSKVAGILTDRPKVDIKVCGVAVSSDAAALAKTAKSKEQTGEAANTKQLKKLARQRSIAVREYLISVSKKDGHQLIGCLPAVEANDAKSLPRADLLI